MMRTPPKNGLLKRLKRDNEGMVFVEAAFTITVLFLLVLLVWDVGSLFVRQMQITNAVRAGTQYAIVRKPISGDTSQIEQAVKNAAPEGASPTVNADLYCECADGTKLVCSSVCGDGSERQAFITINYAETYDLLFGFPGFGSSFDLKDEATIRLN